MGSDKYLMNLHGAPQYQHLFDLLSGLGLSVYLSCNRTQNFQLPVDYPKIMDRHEAIGPMGGLASAIDQFPTYSWLVVACDLVNLTRNTVQKLLEADEGSDVVTCQISGSVFLETTITVYHPGSFDVVRQAVEAGNYSLQQVLAQCEVKVIPTAGHELKNVNRPEDLE